MPDAPSIRETIESAMNAEPEAVEAPAPVEVEAAPEPVETTEPQETAAEAAQRARDDKGRFAPKAEAKPAEKTTPEPAKKTAPAPVRAAPVAPPVAPPSTEAHPVKAPQSWKPAVRELAAKLPAEFRPILDEVHRRETETARVLQETSEARRTVEQVRATLQPFDGVARANGFPDTMSYAGSVLQMAAVLQMGTQVQKDAALAQLINQFGGSIDGINSHLSGQAPTQRAAPAPQQDVSRIVEQEFQRRMQAASEQKATSDWEAFQATAPEFLDDVKEDMRVILELAGRQGRNMTYQQAYDRAVKLNENVAPVLEARKAAEAARAKAPTVQRSKAAAVSIKATPAAAVTRPTGPRSLREDIEAAVAESQRT